MKSLNSIYVNVVKFAGCREGREGLNLESETHKWVTHVTCKFGFIFFRKAWQHFTKAHMKEAPKSRPCET